MRHKQSREDGWCLVYEDGRQSPIAEVKTRELAERVVMALWDRYGPRFHRSDPAHKKQLSGATDRFRVLVGPTPASARDPLG
jgi:hypothetical protein